MTDIVFLFLFLPVSMAVALLKPCCRRYGLLLLSLFYYACGSPGYFLLLLGMLLMDVALAYGIRAAHGRGRLAVFLAGVAVNLCVLFFYKFYELKAVSGGDGFLAAREVLLPMGLSFFVFKSLSLLIDVYKGDINLGKNPVDSVLYLSYFAQSVSGPVCRYGDFYGEAGLGQGLRALRERFSQGGYLFVKGFLKKVWLADLLGLVTTEVYSMDLRQSSASLLWLGAISYSLQLYYDFSGYSDMAVGISRMHDLGCPQNFNYPYAARSVSEFWRRWHISLGTWFRDYVYIPLGGSRTENRGRRYLNLLAVWILTGFWHGICPKFLFWGLACFAAIAFEKASGLPGKLRGRWGRALYRATVLLYINFQWVIFRSADLRSGLAYIGGMICGYGNRLADIRALVLLKEYGVILAAAVFLAVPRVPFLGKRVVKGGGKPWPLQALSAVLLFLLFICGISFVAAGQNNPFLYGNF